MKIPHCYTTAALASGVAFTSDWQYHTSRWLHGTVNPDQASAAEGFVIQQSPDGTAVTHEAKRTVAANQNLAFDIQLYSRWVRIVYTNGALDQATFSLEASLVGEA